MSAQPVEAPEPHAYSRDLTTVIGEVLPHAGKYGDLPVLNAVLLRAEGEVLTASATDRHTLGISQTVWQGGDLPASLLRLDDAVELLRILKGRASRTGPGEPLTVKVSGTSITFGIPGLSVAYELQVGTFPNFAKLLAKERPASDKPGAQVALNADYLARFKAARRSSWEPVHLNIAGSARCPVLVTVGSHFTAAIMPLRGDAP